MTDLGTSLTASERRCTLYPQLPPDTRNVSEKLQKSLLVLMQMMCDFRFPALQQNACAALTGALISDKGCVQAALAAGLSSQTLQLLRDASDMAFQRNLISLLGAIAESSYEGLHDFLSSGAMEAILEAGNSDTQGELQHDVCDVICKVGTDPDSRRDLVEVGAVDYLGKSLQSKDAEVQVRSLLSLAMLLEGDDEAQMRLLGADGVVCALFRIVRDAAAESDSKALAQSLITEFTKREDMKLIMMQQLRLSAS